MAPMPLRLSSLSIVLPCHDEAANVERVAREAVEAGRRVTDQLEVLVVDDGSRDDTFERTSALGRELPEVRVVHNAVRRGYGGALRRGFDEARMGWVFFTDGDGQFDLEQLPDLVELLGRCDVAIGYREPRMDPPWRVFNGKMWTALVNLLFGLGVRDVNCAFKLLPRDLLAGADLTADGAAVSAEMLLAARRMGYAIAERPVRHRSRTAGRQTGGDPRVAARAFREIGRLYFRRALVPPSRALP